MIRTVTQEVAKRSDPLSRCLDRFGAAKRGCRTVSARAVQLSIIWHMILLYDTANLAIGKREITWFSPLMM
jgi:hypothetical protein